MTSPSPVIIVSNTLIIAQGLATISQKYFKKREIRIVLTSESLIQELKENPTSITIIHFSENSLLTMSAATALSKEYKTPGFLAVISNHYPNAIEQILQYNLQYCIEENVDEKEWQSALDSICSNEKYCSVNILLKVLEHKTQTIQQSTANTLTPRQTEILKDIALGYTDKQISEKKQLSPHTVHSHRKSIKKRLGIHTASELTVYAVKNGLIKFD